MASADPTLEPYCITEGFPKPAERIQQRCTRLLSRQPTTLLAGMPLAASDGACKRVVPLR